MTISNKKPLLSAESIAVRFDGVTALDDFSMVVAQGEILGIIGPNGAGKTTLFNVLSGFLAPDAGTVRLGGHDITSLRPDRVARLGLARTFQEVRLLYDLTVIDNLLLAFPHQPGERLANILLRPWRCFSAERCNRQLAVQILDELGLSTMAFDRASSLSYGQQKLISLASSLASKPQAVLLDEPIAGIAPEARERVLEMIKRQVAKGVSVVIIEHDMDVISSLCERVVFMDSGRKICEGTPEHVRNDPQVIEAYLE